MTYPVILSARSFSKSVSDILKKYFGKILNFWVENKDFSIILSDKHDLYDM